MSAPTRLQGLPSHTCASLVGEERISVAECLVKEFDANAERVERCLRQLRRSLAASPQANLQVEALMEGLAVWLQGLGAAHERLRGENEELRKAKAEAEATNTAKDRFLADVAHETRTPLTAILGLIALTRREALSPEAARYLRVADFSAQALLRILDDLLDLAKIRAGRFDLKEVVFELRPMVQSAVETFALEAREKGLDLRCSFGLGVPARMEGDPGRLRQVLLNLIRNAIQCTQEGEVAVHVEADPERRAGETAPFVNFSVSDTGRGIAAEELELIFQDYQQLGLADGGAGLGLSISKRLTQAMGGDLRVSSSPRKGSSFVASIPLGRGKMELSRDLSPGPRTSLACQEEEEPPSHPLRVLVVEDEAATALVVSAVLKAQGFDETTVSTGREAVASFRSGAFDVVLMDLHMPDMNGEESARAIRDLEAEQGEHVPILGFTAHACSEEKSRCAAAGMDGFLDKPFSIEELQTEILRHARPVSPRVVTAPQEDLRRKHFPTFWKTCLLQRDEMREAIDAGDAGGLRCAAHAVRGSAAVFGLSEVSALAGDLEEIGRGGTVVKAAEVFQRLEQELKAVVARRQT